MSLSELVTSIPTREGAIDHLKIPEWGASKTLEAEEGAAMSPTRATAVRPGGNISTQPLSPLTSWGVLVTSIPTQENVISHSKLYTIDSQYN